MSLLGNLIDNNSDHLFIIYVGSCVNIELEKKMINYLRKQQKQKNKYVHPNRYRHIK